jgi:prolyl-tRNA editing enzyme YbaK/EbsC (Cys-tRNA(Pro) deacylase)
MALQMEDPRFAPNRVRSALIAAGASACIQSFDASTRTAADAAKAVGTTVGQIVKSLIFMANGEPVLALVSGSNQLDPAKLAALVGAPISKADADAVRQATGYVIGGVPPIGFSSPIPTYIDRELLAYDLVWAAAGTPHHVFQISPALLVRLTGGTVVDLKR